MFNWISPHFPNLHQLLAPLHSLISKKQPWVWSDDLNHRFEVSKTLVPSILSPIPYDEVAKGT